MRYDSFGGMGKAQDLENDKQKSNTCNKTLMIQNKTNAF
jgi:hypothetical protein